MLDESGSDESRPPESKHTEAHGELGVTCRAEADAVRRVINSKMEDVVAMLGYVFPGSGRYLERNGAWRGNHTMGILDYKLLYETIE